MKVLLVDDEPMVLESSGRLLRNLGFDVALVGRADQILERLRAERPDVLLQDVRMPGLDLPRLVRAIRADPDVGTVPVVLCSASIDVGETAATVGADDYIEKPYRPEELVAKLEGVGRAPEA